MEISCSDDKFSVHTQVNGTIKSKCRELVQEKKREPVKGTGKKNLQYSRQAQILNISKIIVIPTLKLAKTHACQSLTGMN